MDVRKQIQAVLHDAVPDSVAPQPLTLKGAGGELRCYAYWVAAMALL